MKVDSAGNCIWDKSFGGHSVESGYNVQLTSDGGYILVGNTLSYGVGEFDVWLIKTDGSGNMQWNKTYGTIKDDQGWCVQQTSDGGFVIVGTTDSTDFRYGNIWLIKTDSFGNMQWNKSFGSNEWNIGKSVRQTLDSGYIIFGTHGQNNWDAWLIKTNIIGNQIWSKKYGGPSHDYGYSGLQTDDGSLIFTGGLCNIDTTSKKIDLFLMRTDSSGNLFPLGTLISKNLL